MSDLFEEEQRLTGEYEATRSYRTGTLLREERHEIADRLSLPFAALAVAFVGAPLSARTSHGTGGSRLHLFTSGLAVILLYYLLRVVLEPSSVRSLTTSILNVWIPNLALIAIGLGLLWRVDRI